MYSSRTVHFRGHSSQQTWGRGPSIQVSLLVLIASFEDHHNHNILALSNSRPGDQGFFYIICFWTLWCVLLNPTATFYLFKRFFAGYVVTSRPWIVNYCHPVVFGQGRNLQFQQIPWVARWSRFYHALGLTALGHHNRLRWLERPRKWTDLDE